MSVTIVGASIEERIQRHIESGRYADASEVVSRALDVLENEEKLELLRELIAEADAEFECGEYFEWTSTSMAEIWAEADEEDRLGIPIPDHVKP